jgi:hypothetical protein
MSGLPRGGPTIEEDGWTLVSAEERHVAHPDMFEVPSWEARTCLLPGDGVKLLFDIETREDGRVVDRGVDRMWVIVRSRREGRYVGVLDSEPGLAEGILLHAGDEIVFGPEHVAEIDRPPRKYIVEKYGADFGE